MLTRPARPTTRLRSDDGPVPLPKRHLGKPPGVPELAARLLYLARVGREEALPRIGVELERDGVVAYRCWRDGTDAVLVPEVRSVTEVRRVRSLARHEEIAFASHLLHEHGYDLVRVFDRTFADVYRRPS